MAVAVGRHDVPAFRLPALPSRSRQVVAELQNQRTGIKESWSDVAVAAGGLCSIRSSSSAVILRMESGQPGAIYPEQFGKLVAPQPS